jgi:hypothetical protein
LKIRQAAEKLAKSEAKKLEKARQKEEMKHMSKSKKEAYKKRIAAKELIEKEEAKERAKAIRKENGNKAKTTRTYPCPKWMEDCYGARISGKTRERIIMAIFLLSTLRESDQKMFTNSYHLTMESIPHISNALTDATRIGFQLNIRNLKS